MTTSSSNNYNATRTQILTRALRIINAVGQGETPNATALTEAAQALNDIVAEWNTDGMQQWKLRTYTCTPLVSGTNNYNIGTGSTFNFPAPLKVIQAYLHDTATDVDIPLVIIDRDRYHLESTKTGDGQPNQIFYQTPKEIQASAELIGTIYLLPTPNTYAATNLSLVLIGQDPLDDMDAAGDTLDFPPYWINALVWGVADQLSYEYGVGLAERAMISKKAEIHKDKALSFGTEEGSLFIQPTVDWG